MSVNWHNDGRNFWDTHGNNFNRLKDDLIPPADQALFRLLEDLERRGMLDDTIIAWVGEFGASRKLRPPWDAITGRAATADYWPAAAFAVVQSTVRAMPRPPIRPSALLAARFCGHDLPCLGNRSPTKLTDRKGRPLAICEGRDLRHSSPNRDVAGLP